MVISVNIDSASTRKERKALMKSGKANIMLVGDAGRRDKLSRIVVTDQWIERQYKKVNERHSSTGVTAQMSGTDERGHLLRGQDRVYATVIGPDFAWTLSEYASKARRLQVLVNEINMRSRMAVA